MAEENSTTILEEEDLEELDPEGSDPGPAFDPEDLIGDTLAGRYEIERRIGRGGMGVVYLASQSALNRQVVVKVLARNIGDEEEAIQRFEREALGLSQLQHPNIVTIYDFGRDGDLAYIVMEYVEGETLSKLQRREGAIGFEEFAGIATQILDALSEAHRRGIIHRDIKPSNIMLCERHGHTNFVKVLDFGLAKLVHDAVEVTKKQNLVGSVAFLAPEQILGLDFDQRVDVYALGVLFYYMLSGQKPFRGEDDISVLYQHIHKEPTPLTEVLPAGHDVPDQIVALLHKCLSKDPKERPSDARQLLNELQMDMSRSIFQVPWATGEFSPVAPPQAVAPSAHSGVQHVLQPGQPHPQTGRITPPESGQMAAVPPATPHSGVLSVSPNTDLSGQYAQVPAHASMSHSGIFALPPEQQGTNKLAILIGVAVIAALALAAGAFFFAMQGGGGVGGEDPQVQRARVAAVFEETDQLVEEEHWGQAESMLESIQQDARAHPDLLKRSAQLEEKISVGKLIQQAQMAEESGSINEARTHYKRLLEIDPSHEHARARISALPSDPSKGDQEAVTANIKLTASTQGEVFVDGASVGSTPLKHQLDPGAYTVEVRAEDHEPWSREIKVGAGETAVLDATLEEQQAEDPPPRNARTQRPRRDRGQKKSTKKEPEDQKKEQASVGGTEPRAGEKPTAGEKPAGDKPKAGDTKRKASGLLFPIDDKKKRRNLAAGTCSPSTASGLTTSQDPATSEYPPPPGAAGAQLHPR